MSDITFTPKNWKHFQHYKDRKPTWIKLHRELLDDYEFSCLPVASRALAPMLWLLASEYDDGIITGGFEAVAFRMRTTVEALAKAIQPLINAGFFEFDSKSLAECYPSAIPERETERETETEGFKEFWLAYPRKVGKGTAEKEYKKALASTSADKILAAVQLQKSDASWRDPKYIPHPATWLRGGRWDDELTVVRHSLADPLAGIE
jgi:hypothetical protein